MNKWAIISSKTRVFQAMVLVRSIRSNGDDSDIHILATDDSAFKVISKLLKEFPGTYVYREVDIVPDELINLKYNRKYFAYCWTLKSILCEFLLERSSADSTVTYVDSDIIFFGNVTRYLSTLKYSTFFTSEEHYFPNIENEKFANLKNLVGNFNSGFISFRNDPQGKKCLSWWKSRCIESCDVNSETFGDQKYLNKMPELFENVLYEESKKLNVGPWNILKRKVDFISDRFLFGDEYILFYHFVGLRLKGPNNISLIENVPTSIDKFFSLNPSGLKIYDSYIKKLEEEILLIQNEFPSFNGYTDQDKDDWATYQKENDVLGMN